MKNYIISILFFLDITSISTYAQPFINIASYDNNRHGINNNVRHIIQDKTGLIWLSTYDGLYKFDGNSFTCYKATIDNDSPLISNHIEQLCENSNQDLWCLVKNKPFLFERPQNRFSQPNNIKSDTLFNQWDIDNIYNISGKTIFTTNKGGVFSINDIDHSHISHLFIPEKPISYPIHQIINDQQEGFWIFFKDKTIIIHRNSQITFNSSFQQMIETVDRYWLISNNGQIAYTDSLYSTPQILPNPYQIRKIHSSLKYKEKFIYFATDQGILILNTQNHEQQFYHLPISSMEAEQLYIDSQDQLWISTNQAIVLKMKLTTHKLEIINIQTKHPQENVNIHSFIEDTIHHNIWLCNNTHTDFWFLSKEQNQFIHEPINEMNTFIRSRLLDKDGNLWIGNHEGLKLITFHENKFQNKSICEEVLCIFKEKNGNIWYSTREGYLRINDPSLNFLGYLDENGNLTKEKKKFNRVICQIIEDSQNNIWMAARRNGLLLLKKKEKATLKF